MVKRTPLNYPNRIHALRTDRKWSQGELGRRCVPPTSASKIGKLELGEQQLTEQWMRRLAGAFGISVAELLSPTGSAAAAHLSESDAVPYEARAGVVLAEQLYPGRRRTFVMRASSDAMQLAGIRLADYLVVDPDLTPKDGDTVVLQALDKVGEAETLLREYHGNVAIPRSPAGHHKPVALEDRNVELRGVVVARWSQPTRRDSAA